MAKKILVIGSGDEGSSSLMLQSFKEKYDDDVVLVTPEEAKEQGLKSEDFANVPTMKITAPPMMKHPMIIGTPLSGKEKRRQRREEERKYNKKSKW